MNLVQKPRDQKDLKANNESMKICYMGTISAEFAECSNNPLRRSRMKFREILEERSNTHYAKFIAIIEKLGTSYLAFATPVFYTSHGIDHSENVEGIADDLIPDHLKDEMNTEEIFLLLCSIYFHDVGMALLTKGAKGAGDNDDYFRQVDEARRMHSEKTASFMLSNYKEFGLSAPQAEIIAHVCRAHSDIKKDDGTRIYTFAEIMKRADIANIDITQVRLKYLAAILRLADELDITARRAPGERMGFADLPSVSQMEWMKHQIFGGINIDPTRWLIDLSISEAMLYGGGGKEGTEVAVTNKLVTDVAIKIRKSLAEVRPPLIKEDVLYSKIRFSDPVILTLEGIFEDYGIRPDGLTFIYDTKNNTANKSCVKRFLCEIERLEISPEYCVSKTMDGRLFQSVEFFRNFEDDLFIVANTTKVGDNGVVEHIRNSIVGVLGDYAKKRGFGGKTYTDKREEYLAYIDFAGRYIIGCNRDIIGEFTMELNFEIAEILKDKGIFKEKIDDANPFIELTITNILNDMFLHERRRIMQDKSDNHHYLHIIPRSYFSNPINASEQDAWISDFKRTLSYLKNIMDTSSGNFRLYYHNGDINLDYKLVASECVILPGRDPLSSVVLTETESIIQFYDDFHRMLASDDTWFIEDIDTKQFRIRLGKDEVYQNACDDPASARREKVELELNKFISEAINETADHPTDASLTVVQHGAEGVESD